MLKKINKTIPLLFPPKTLAIEPQGISVYSKKCFGFSLPLLPGEGDSCAEPFFSRWSLFENGIRLGPAHRAADEIAEHGGGMFQHWGNQLWFSASDGTDPRINERRYVLKNEEPLFSHWLIRRLALSIRKNFFYRHSLANIIFCIITMLLNRLLLAASLLPEILNKEDKSRVREFEEFYTDLVLKWDSTEKNSLEFGVAFVKWTEKKVFDRYRDRIQDPSLEIGVYNGVTSKLFFDYPFTVGTELAFDEFKNLSHQFRHREFRHLDLKDYAAFPYREKFRSIVMVHSLDDFTSPKTDLVFKAFRHLAQDKGLILFSGFTNLFTHHYKPLAAAKKRNPQISLYALRQMHTENLPDYARLSELIRQESLQWIHYEEFNKDPLFIRFYMKEDPLTRLIWVSALRKIITRIDFLSKIHKRFNAILADALWRREEKLQIREDLRGLNFFALIQKSETNTFIKA